MSEHVFPGYFNKITSTLNATHLFAFSIHNQVIEVWTTFNGQSSPTICYIVFVGFVAKNVTVSLTIPSLDVPVLVQSVNNWIGFQQRINSSLDFNRSWSEYKSGFGIYNGNFWMGLEKIYQLTSSGQYRLRFELLTIDGRWISSEYDTFQTGQRARKLYNPCSWLFRRRRRLHGGSQWKAIQYIR